MRKLEGHFKGQKPTGRLRILFISLWYFPRLWKKFVDSLNSLRFVVMKFMPICQKLPLGLCYYCYCCFCVSSGRTFRVYVVLPLLPAFEGQLGTSTGTSIQAVIHWNYNSICRGGNSLLERLVRAGGGIIAILEFQFCLKVFTCRISSPSMQCLLRMHLFSDLVSC